MPQVRRPLSGLDIAIAKRTRICHRSRANHDIAPGETHLTVRNADGLGVKNYCGVHAADILRQAEDDLRSIRTRLGLDS